jgi:hypothetical protein
MVAYKPEVNCWSNDRTSPGNYGWLVVLPLHKNRLSHVHILQFILLEHIASYTPSFFRQTVNRFSF